MTSAASPRSVACPTCGRRVAWTDSSRFRPFCSERCKLIDLGEWAMERHAIPDDSAGFVLDDPGVLQDERGRP